MAINFKAPFFLIQAVASHILDNGRIINVSTGFTRIAAPTHPLYAASKGALETLTLSLAPEFGRRGITVNTVMPGVTDTDMNADWLSGSEARAGAEAMSVFSRVGKPEDVADVIAQGGQDAESHRELRDSEEIHLDELQPQEFLHATSIAAPLTKRVWHPETMGTTVT